MRIWTCQFSLYFERPEWGEDEFEGFFFGPFEVRADDEWEARELARDCIDQFQHDGQPLRSFTKLPDTLGKVHLECVDRSAFPPKRNHRLDKKNYTRSQKEDKKSSRQMRDAHCWCLIFALKTSRIIISGLLGRYLRQSLWTGYGIYWYPGQ